MMETLASPDGLLCLCSAGRMVNAVHTNPTGMDRKWFLTQGTVFVVSVAICDFYYGLNQNELRFQNIMRMLILQVINVCFLVYCEELLKKAPDSTGNCT